MNISWMSKLGPPADALTLVSGALPSAVFRGVGREEVLGNESRQHLSPRFRSGARGEQIAELKRGTCEQCSDLLELVITSGSLDTCES